MDTVWFTVYCLTWLGSLWLIEYVALLVLSSSESIVFEILKEGKIIVLFIVVATAIIKVGIESFKHLSKTWGTNFDEIK